MFARMTESAREPSLRLTLGILVLLHVWTAIALLGSRYAVGL
jgi:hypothetical protein